MLPANGLLLKCPYCGGTKTVLQLMSGNTCGATLWSDCKQQAPMLPRVSSVQRCPHCGHYFIASRDVNIGESDDWSFNTGALPLEYLTEAVKEITPKNSVEEENIHITYIWAFNDRYGDKERTEIPADDWTLFVEAIHHVVTNTNDLCVKAEMLREIEEFDQALEILQSPAMSQYEAQWVNPIKEHTMQHDRKVFRMYGDGERDVVTLENYNE